MCDENSPAQTTQKAPPLSDKLERVLWVCCGISVRALNRTASAAFILGFVLFFVAVGASGWIGSRRLRIFTTAVGVLASVAGLLFVLRSRRSKSRV
jgi:hypothetical protein